MVKEKKDGNFRVRPKVREKGEEKKDDREETKRGELVSYSHG